MKYRDLLLDESTSMLVEGNSIPAKAYFITDSEETVLIILVLEDEQLPALLEFKATIEIKY